MLPGILSVVVGKIRRIRAVEGVVVAVSEILPWGSQLVSWAVRS